MKKLIATLLVVYCFLAGALLVTMDMDLGGGRPRRVANDLIDFFEVIGLDNLYVGLALPAVVLGVLWLWLRARGPGSN